MPKVSIIVPVFGVERYIERCARSLFEQTFDDLEYIFIDDCTKDYSIDVLNQVMDAYPHKKDYVRIIHHDVNKGLPQARRTGMLSARGDYIINFDSDDWVDPTIIEVMYNHAIECNSDVVICDMCLTDGNYKHIIKGCYNTEKKTLIKDLCTHPYIWSTCNKLLKRELIDENTVFPKSNMGEDMAFIIPLLLKAERFSYVPDIYYYYYNNNDSMTKIDGEEITLNKYRMLSQNLEIVISSFKKEGLYNEFRDIIDVLKFGLKKTLLGIVYKKEYYSIWKNTYPEINYRILLNKNIICKDKLVLLLTYMHLYPR